MGTPPSTTRAGSLSWYPPTSAALLALTNDPPDRPAAQRDPGMLLHILRFARPTPAADDFQLHEQLLGQPGLCETAASLAEQLPARDGPPAALEIGLQLAEAGRNLALETGLAAPDAAWAAGLLAPLGWYAAELCGESLPHSREAAALARRLLARWRLPRWLQTAVGFPELPLRAAVSLGGHLGLMRVLRAAVQSQTAFAEYIPLAANDDSHSPLAPNPQVNPPPSAKTKTLSPTAGSVERIDPTILGRLLRMCAKSRHRSAVVLVNELESTVDTLQNEVHRLSGDFQLALRDAKLDAMAEFTAGASHEINNPLAVISGNCQYLQNRETDADKRKALEAIRRQTRRIHDILLAARHFARPPQPQPVWLDANDLAARAVKELETVTDLLGGVSLEVHSARGAVALLADADQVRQALQQLLRNGVEAAGPEGCVRLSVELRPPYCELVVDDSGGGPDAAVVPHLFDPFFSGKSAGRGRGLGLTLAWRYARLNGGDVLYAPRAGRPGRFVLRLPLAEATPLAQSA